MLPVELVESILIYLPYETTILVHIGHYIKQYNSNEEIWKWAAMNGHLDVILYLYENHIEGYTKFTMSSAAYKGHFSIIKYLHSHGKGCNSGAIDLAAANGHLNIIKFIHKNYPNVGCSHYAMIWAISGGYFDIVKYIHENELNYILGLSTIMAIENNKFEIYKWLYDNTTDFNFILGDINTAAETGRLDFIKFIREKILFKCLIQDAKKAANKRIKLYGPNRNCTVGSFLRFIGVDQKNNIIDKKIIVKYFTSETLENAAKNGHLPVVEYLHSIGANYTTNAMFLAAKNDHHEVVKFLKENYLNL